MKHTGTPPFFLISEIMCGCGVNVVARDNAMGFVNTIPVAEVSSGSRGKFKYYFCISPEKVNQALSGIMVQPNVPLKVGSMADMEQLADYHDQKLDVKNYGQNLWSLLQKINFTQEELTKSECSTAFIY